MPLERQGWQGWQGVLGDGEENLKQLARRAVSSQAVERIDKDDLAPNIRRVFKSPLVPQPALSAPVSPASLNHLLTGSATFQFRISAFMCRAKVLSAVRGS